MLEGHLEKLRAFYATAKEGSFIRAASALGVTQPAVTKSVQLLENETNTKLFIRQRRGVELTQAGVLLHQFCKGLFLRVRDIEKQIQNTHSLAGVLRVGTYETLGELFWPKVLKRINTRYPDLVVELKTESTRDIWNELESGALDLIVDAEPRTAVHLFSKVLYKDDFQIYACKNSRFLKRAEKIPISYVRKAFDRYQKSIEWHLRQMELPVELLYDVESFTMVRSFVLEDVCIGVLPLRMAREYLKNGTLVEFAKNQPFGEHRISVTCLDANQKEVKIRTLMTLLKEMA